MSNLYFFENFDVLTFSGTAFKSTVNECALEQGLIDRRGEEHPGTLKYLSSLILRSRESGSIFAKAEMRQRLRDLYENVSNTVFTKICVWCALHFWESLISFYRTYARYLKTLFITGRSRTKVAL